MTPWVVQASTSVYGLPEARASACEMVGARLANSITKAISRAVRQRVTNRAADEK